MHWIGRVRGRRALMLLAALGACEPSPRPPADGYADAPGGARLFYHSAGDGSPILVIHGGPGMDSRYLRPGLDRLSERGRVTFYDQRGTGLSEGGLEPARTTFDQFVDDVDAVRAAIGEEQVTVIGHSYGGLLALEYARRYPQRVERLVLVNTSEPGAQYAAQANERRAARLSADDAAALRELGRSGALQAGDTAAFRQFYEAAFRATFVDPTRLGELDLSMAPATAKNGMAVIRGVGGSADFTDGWARLREVSAPTLVIQGRDDLPPVAMAAAIVDSIPNAELAVIEAAGHFPWIERPEAFFTALRTWWERAAPS